MKTCSKCHVEKSLSEFHKKTAAKDGRQSKCKSCNNKNTRDWQAKNYEQFIEKAKDYSKTDKTKLRRRARLYGIDVELLAELTNAHGTMCPVCGRDNNGKQLSADHCHKSLEFRGLLCAKCNFVLGLVDDRPEILSALIEYLKN